MKKKIVTLFLSACALLALGFTACNGSSSEQNKPNSSNSESIENTDASSPQGNIEKATEDLEYFPLPDNTYAVAQGNTQHLEEIIIPATHDGKKVTAIAENGFENAKLQSITIPNSVTSIGEYAFYDCSSLTSVYYGGSAEDWANITIDSYNTSLTKATRYYYSESKPALNADSTAYDGNYWHYVNGVATPWVYTKEE